MELPYGEFIYEWSRDVQHDGEFSDPDVNSFSEYLRDSFGECRGEDEFGEVHDCDLFVEFE